MTTKTRYFVIVSLLVMGVGLGTGLVAYYVGGLPAGAFASRGGPEELSFIPRDATVIAVLPDVPLATALVLGSLRRRGLAVTVVLIVCDEDRLVRCYGRLLAEGIRDVRHLKDEAGLSELCRAQVHHLAPYGLA